MNSFQVADEHIESLLDLHWSIISIFFKGFDEEVALPEGLNPTHFKAAMMLKFHEPMTMTELSRRLTLEKGSFTPVAARLIDKGLVEKVQSEEDRRVYNLVLSAEGRKLTDWLRKAHWRYIQSMLERLSPEEQEEYFDKMSRLNVLNNKITKGGAPDKRHPG